MTTFSALKSNRSSLQSLNEAIAKSTKSYAKEDAESFGICPSIKLSMGRRSFAFFR